MKPHARHGMRGKKRPCRLPIAFQLKAARKGVAKDYSL
jgi:hypothetical protein